MASSLFDSNKRGQLAYKLPRHLLFLFNMPSLILLPVVFISGTLLNNGMTYPFSIWFLSIFVLSLVWLFGEGYRHIYLSIVPYSILLSHYFINSLNLTILYALVALSIAAIVVKLYRFDRDPNLHMVINADFVCCCNVIKDRKKDSDIILCLPLSYTYQAAYFTDGLMLQGSGGEGKGYEFNLSLSQRIKSEGLRGILDEYKPAWGLVVGDVKDSCKSSKVYARGNTSVLKFTINPLRQKAHPPKVIVIILNWNGLRDSLECLQSLDRITYPNYELVVVDNGSTDGSVPCLRFRYPDLTIIENTENLGFAGGNNVGIRYAQAKGASYVLLLNNDTVVAPRFLDALVTVAENDSRVAVVGPLVVYHDDPSTIWSAGGKINLFTGTIANRGANRPRASCRGVQRVDYVSGCALLIKADVIENIGLLDEDYFLYLEDADWNFRTHVRGYLSLTECDTQILHKVGSSLARSSDSYYLARNTLLFFKKHGRWYHLAAFVLSFCMRYGAMFVWNALWGTRSRGVYIVEGVRDYLKGKYGAYQ